MSPQLLALLAEEVPIMTEDGFNSMFGVIPFWAVWLGAGVIVALIIIFILVGFFKEMKKKK